MLEIISRTKREVKFVLDGQRYLIGMYGVVLRFSGSEWDGFSNVDYVSNAEESRIRQLLGAVADGANRNGITYSYS